MQQSKLVQHLEALPGKERERFRTFVYSPYFNQHQKTIELLNLLLDYVNGKNGRPITREWIFESLFPSEGNEMPSSSVKESSS